MNLYVGITENNWFRFLAGLPDVDEVNFWQPSGARAFRSMRVPVLVVLLTVVGGCYAVSTLKNRPDPSSPPHHILASYGPLAVPYRLLGQVRMTRYDDDRAARRYYEMQSGRPAETNSEEIKGALMYAAAQTYGAACDALLNTFIDCTGKDGDCNSATAVAVQFVEPPSTERSPGSAVRGRSQALTTGEVASGPPRTTAIHPEHP
jgi:hypothetical protein